MGVTTAVTGMIETTVLLTQGTTHQDKLLSPPPGSIIIINTRQEALKIHHQYQYYTESEPKRVWGSPDLAQRL